MWLFLWILIVLGAAGFFLWSYHELFEQKRLWKTFSGKNNLAYSGGKMLESPSMSGEMNGRTVNFYPQLMDNAQGHYSLMTVIEVFLNIIPDTSFLVASHGFADFVASVDLPEPFNVEDPEWPNTVMARSFLEERPQDWFTAHKDRVRGVQQLVKLPFHTAFVADGQQAFIAVRTANPLNDERKLQQLISKMYDIAAMLEAQPHAAAPAHGGEKTSAPEIGQDDANA